MLSSMNFQDITMQVIKTYTWHVLKMSSTAQPNLLKKNKKKKNVSDTKFMCLCLR